MKQNIDKDKKAAETKTIKQKAKKEAVSKSKTEVDENSEKNKKTASKRTKKQEKLGLTYKGYPLARFNNIIYYGDPKEKYILKLIILETKKEKDLNIATKVSVELLNSANHNICKKSTTKNSLYHALDIGQIWLKKILTDEQSFN